MSVNVVLKTVFDDKGIKQAQAQFGKLGKTIGIGVAAAAAAAVAATAAVADFAGKAILAAEGVETANNRLGQISKSMGIFGSEASNVTQRLIKFAEANELNVAVDAEVIKATQAKLLTFKQLAQTADETGGSFDRATMAALDLAAAGFGSAETNAIQLGKALQDPVKGITALARAGVTFTKQEKEQIKTLVESGKVLQAQDLILTSIETQVGGTAEATAKASDKMALAFDNVYESVGTALLPVVDEFTTAITDLTPQISDALIPIAEQLATVFRDNVLPAIQNFTAWLASPEGVQAIKDLTTAIVNGVKGFFDFTKAVVDNWDAITKIAAVIGIAVVAFNTLTTAAALAQAATILFSGALTVTPLGWVLAGLTALVAGFAALTIATEGYRDTVEEAIKVRKESTEEENKARNELENLRLKQVQLQAQVENNVGYMKSHYQKELDKTKGRVNQLEVALQGANSELIRFAKLAPAASTVAPATKGEDNRFRNLKKQLEEINEIVGGGGGGGGGESTADRFKKIQKIIQTAQANILKAEQSYARAKFEINRDYEDRVAALRKSAADSQFALIRDSQARLTSAFKSATQTSLSDLFSSETTRELETQVKQLTSRLTVSVTRETEKTTYSSVTDIINGLRDRLSASKTLLANASELAALGFKQTFIEQVLETGTETGNALSSAILEASPDTQRELRDLFVELEDVSETGADSLAKGIYDKFGLATRAMKEQSVSIQGELNDALKAESEILTRSLADAAYAFQTQIADIKTQFLLDLAEFDGAFAGLGKTIKDVLANLAKLTGAATTDIQAAITAPGGSLPGATVTDNVAIKNIKNATGLVIDELSDVKGAAAYLQARINAAQTFIKSSTSNAAQEASAASSIADWTAQLKNLQGVAATGEAAGTVININVKTDTTQSQAMVGKTIGNIVTKYVTTGGQVLVSGS